MDIMYVSVKDLPQVVQSALDSNGYGRKDIQVIASSTVQLSSSAGDGRQGFVSLINLDNNRHETIRGSWGGQNMFNRSNPVDNDNRSHPLPPNGVAIVGVRGGGQPVWAQLHVPASMVSRILTAGPADLTDQERCILGCFKSLRSGDYRKEALRDAGSTEELLNSLAARGLLKRARNGATQITTAGKNEAGSYSMRDYR